MSYAKVELTTQNSRKMNNFVFQSPTEFVFGRDTENQCGDLCKAYGATKVMIVIGGGSARKSGLLARVEASLNKSGIPYCLLEDIKPNPEDTKVYEGIELARKENIDFILPVGGGSVIDTAKAISAGFNYDGDFWDFYCGKNNVENYPNVLPIGVVLTIPVAGSEASGNTVITKTDGMFKLSIRTKAILRPKFAIMNPELTMTLPPYQTAAGIVDMMVHTMERYFSPTQSCEATDRLCEAVLISCINEGPKVIATPNNYEARANIMWLGTMAHNGICGVGRVEDWASHHMEHEISAIYGVTHGAGLSVMVPAWMTFVTKKDVTKIAQFARRVFGVEGNNDEVVATEGINRLKAFWKSIGMPVTMKELGIDNPDIDALVAKLRVNKGDKIGGYVSLSMEDCRNIYEIASKA